MFGPSGLKDYGSATLRCNIWSLSFLGLHPPPSTLVQSEERKGSNVATWQHWLQDGKRLKEAVGRMCKKYLSAAPSDRGSSSMGGGGGGGASSVGLSRDGGGKMSGLVAEFSEDDGGGMVSEI